jgi:hypothetical protein
MGTTAFRDRRQESREPPSIWSIGVEAVTPAIALRTAPEHGRRAFPWATKAAVDGRRDESAAGRAGAARRAARAACSSRAAAGYAGMDIIARSPP